MKVDRPRRKKANKTVIIVLLVSLVVLVGLGIYYSSVTDFSEPAPSATEDVFEEDH